MARVKGTRLIDGKWVVPTAATLSISPAAVVQTLQEIYADDNAFIKEAAMVDPTLPPKLGEAYEECPERGSVPIVRVQFHVGVVVRGLAQTGLHRDGNGGALKCQLWLTPMKSVYVHFVRDKIPDIEVTAANIEFVQRTEAPV